MKCSTVLVLLGCSLLSLQGCADSEEAAVAEVEHPRVVITQWNDSTELFLEYPELVVGTATGNWAIHMSDMKTFKPITEGTLRVRFLRGGAEAASFQIDAPARAGIFLLDPVIAEAGTYQVELSLTSPQVTSVHLLPEVRVWAILAEVPAAAEEAGAGIAFLKEQQWQIAFAVAPALEQDVARTVSAPAELVAPDGALAQVSAPVRGIAAATGNRTAPSVGQTVRAGEVLAVLSPTAGEGGYARAQGELERLEREVERAERLWDAGAIPEKRLEEARHDLAIARAELRAMGAQDRDADFRVQVRAPISGVIADRTFVPGGLVEAGTALFTIVDPSTLWLRVHLPADAATALERGAAATFTVEGVANTYQAPRLVTVGSVLDPSTRTVSAIFAVPNPGAALKVGQFARAMVPLGGVVRAVAIPSSAIIDDNGTPVAYVQVGGESFERRVLTLGARDGIWTQVIDGVRPGEMVVREGGYQVRLASLSGNEFAGGHAH
jgi:membrane fusion protein, heavy metal efflux system